MNVQKHSTRGVIKDGTQKRGNGEGSITKRANGLWMGRITVGRDSETGKLQSKALYGKTRKEVSDKMTEALAKVNTGTSSKQTTGEYLDDWLRTIKNSVKPTTWEGYETQVRVHIKPAIGYVKLQQLLTKHIQNLINAKIQENKLSARSIKYIHVVVNNALEQAIKEQLIMFNPAKAVRLPKQENKEVEALTVEQV